MKSAIFPFALLATASALAFSSSPAFAQQQANDMPPKLEQVDELESTAARPAAAQEASPSRPGGRQIIEKRERGQTTSIEVRSGDNSYYINPGDQPGTVVPGEAQSGTTRTPQWKIFEFDLKRPAQTGDAAPDSGSAAPAAPPAPVK